ncbi:TetR/AcrR family transcriptional regulator [Polyangium jinanense]|uniref:TetR/AcrR family transcriptional regulator n=1 Tax=Polyangium jinanense TaxID=2829994 RepID=A0A9X3XD36_9BACT|nr:TetR/AcrR family transcriptional regulator [Polyangium jinanense]MDC3957051.1 TetR/AcrR family transcriptional regulator [Polyangium jinanense]MDC3987075.1 TetR/AcrR family transcriptional regulator [Polyangium jinanense]
MAACDDEQHRARGERILAEAQELLLGWGYKRVTIDDIARRARVGKGTIYLHWKSKEALFMELLRREMASMLGAQLDDMRGDPRTVLPHRMLRSMFLLHAGRPLARAIFGEDTDILGALAPDRSTPSLARALGLTDLLHRMLQAFREHGLLRLDRSLADQAHSIEAILAGSFLLTKLQPHEAPTLERQADILATTVRDAFERPDPPDCAAVEAAAVRLGKMLDEMRTHLLGGRA